MSYKYKAKIYGRSYEYYSLVPIHKGDTITIDHETIPDRVGYRVIEVDHLAATSRNKMHDAGTELVLAEVGPVPGDPKPPPATAADPLAIELVNEMEAWLNQHYVPAELRRLIIAAIKGVESCAGLEDESPPIHTCINTD